MKSVIDEKNSSFMCVGCGNPASKGSMKHPYCAKCFKELFNEDYTKYFEHLRRTHDVW